MDRIVHFIELWRPLKPIESQHVIREDRMTGDSAKTSTVEGKSVVAMHRTIAEMLFWVESVCFGFLLGGV